MLAGNKTILAELFRDNPLAIARYLTEKLEGNDFETARTHLSLIVRAQNVQMLGRDAGMRRDTLYKTFGGRVDPQLSRILKLFAALNLHLRIVPSVENLPRHQRLPASANANAPVGSLRDNPQLIAGYLTQAFEGNDFEEARSALGQVTQAQNISALARVASIPRRTIYKTFGGKADPKLSRILKLFAALGVQFNVIALPHRQRPPRPKLGRPRKPSQSEAE